MVNNIYLDSHLRRDYHDHINGTANRSKTRVRWYGPAKESLNQPLLERKLKYGCVSGKEVFPLPSVSFHGKPVRLILEEALAKAALPALLSQLVHYREAVLFNCYQRHYFLSRDGTFRLTVDSSLQFDHMHASRTGFAGRPMAAPHVIIELKFAPELAEGACSVTNALPFRLARCSKYVLGIQHLACS